MSLVKTAFVFLVSIACLAVAGSTARAANHFLISPVPVQAQPDLNSNGGVFDLAQSDSGEAVVFWGQADGLFASVRPAGGTFGAPTLITTGAQGTALPKVAMAPDGHAILSWRQSIEGLDQVRIATKPAGSLTFQAPVTVSEEEFQVPSLDPQVGIADDGTARVAWIGRDQDNNANSRIRTRAITAAGQPNGAPFSVSPLNATGVTAPELAVGPTGHAMITWVRGEIFNGDIGTFYISDTGAIVDLQILDTNGGVPAVPAIDRDGNAVIVYQLEIDDAEVIGNYRAGGLDHDFQTDQALQLPGANNSGAARIAMDGTGRATVMFQSFEGGKWSILTTDRPAGADTLFGPTTMAITPQPDVSDSNLGVGDDGTAIIGWTDADDRVFTAVRPSKAPQFSVPTGPVSVQGGEIGEIHPTADGQGHGLTSYSTRIAPASDFRIDSLPYDDTPTANELVIPSTVEQGRPINFSVNPTDPWATVTGVEWELDAGLKKSGPQVSHAYTTPGERMVTLKLTDALGNVTDTGGLVTVIADETAPVLTKVSIKKKKARAGKKNAFRFTLSEDARIVIKFKRLGRLPKAGKGRKKAKRAQGRIVKTKVAAGRRKIGFRGKIGKRRLKPARYMATMVAADQLGNRGKPRKLRFRIIR